MKLSSRGRSLPGNRTQKEGSPPRTSNIGVDNDQESQVESTGDDIAPCLLARGEVEKPGYTKFGADIKKKKLNGSGKKKRKNGDRQSDRL